MTQKPVRKSGIELLRIFAVCGVILLHYNNPLIGKAFQYTGGGNLAVLYGLESLFCCAVDVFILISGYFMCKNNARAISKPISLILMVVVINVLFFCYSFFAGNVSPKHSDILQIIIPHNYFVTLYVALYFISPFINRIFEDFDKRQWRLLLIVSLLIFSLWPTLADLIVENTHQEWFGLSTIGAWGSQSGHNIVNFVLLYCLGAYIRIGEIDKMPISSFNLIMSVGCCLMLSFCWAWFSSHDAGSMGRSAWAYHNPLTIMMAVLMFVLFSRIHITNKIINDVAKAAFACFLIHAHVITHMSIKEFVQRPIPIMLIHIMVCMIASYALSYIFFKVYDLTIDKLVKKNIKKAIVL